ncbi:hypothetical protein [Catellatospora sichuanensis]|uniref:hypothetical protein n=1 Tax=Catellatospora sichuanensis TaxID=1969805 RepID=UPI001182997A|nr:hypothetical protein [Catellatospora sichuanensis]
MKLRHVLISAGTVLLAFALLPVSSAAALDDLVCVDERSETVSHHFESTLHHYCARWRWSPPKVGDHGDSTGTKGEDDPDGGKGGTPDFEDCDVVKEDLARTKEALDLVNKQLDAANIWLGDAMGREATAEAAAAQALDTWRRAEADVDFFFTAYATANGLDTEIEVEIRPGITVVRPVAAFRPDHDKAFGVELHTAMNRELVTRAARNAAAAAYQEVGEELIDAHSAVANLTSRQAALIQAIERLQSRVGRC